MKKSTKVYLQIKEKLELEILAGIHRPGERLPSLREAAKCQGVNVSTIERSYGLLEESNLIYKVRNIGFFVITDADVIENKRVKWINYSTRSLVNTMLSYGFRKEEIASLIKIFIEKI